MSSRSGRSQRVLWAALCCVMLAIPFFSVRFAPITDLPQQVAQIRLLLDALQNPDTPYAVQWWTPNRLSYAVLGMLWGLLPPIDVGRFAMLLIGVLWVAALHYLSARRNRSVATAILASTLFFNQVMYWGFYNFALGWVAFAGWFLLLARSPSRTRSWTEAVWICAGGLVLYLSHVLWLLAGIVWLILRSFLHRSPRQVLLFRLLGLAPLLALLGMWYPTLMKEGFQSSTVWQYIPWQRLDPSWYVMAVFGGLQGWLEAVFTILIVVYLVASVVTNRHGLLTKCDREMLTAGAMFLAFALFLPYQHTNTILVAERWFPIAMVMLLLALPIPSLPVRLAPLLRRGVALGLLGIFCATTAVKWVGIEKREFSGLQDALTALPPEPSVLWLEYTLTIPELKTRPFVQTGAYAQVVKGGTLSFSFADFANSLVIYRPDRPRPWTRGLEWNSGNVVPADFQYFTHVLVGGSERAQKLFIDAPFVRAITPTGRWRLYRVEFP